MRYVIISVLLFHSFFQISGQIKFEKGYIIDNSGVKTECLIRNLDWRDNPRVIQYKLSEESDIVSGSIDFIKEFKVDNYPRFVRYDVKIDRSSSDIVNLSKTRSPRVG